jgi:hypothetical protein
VSSATHTRPGSKVQLWGSRIAMAIAVLFLLLDIGGKLARIAPVTESFARLGLPDHLARTIGVLQLATLLWGALYLRDARLRALIPLRR